jgi:hypothetical protein
VKERTEEDLRGLVVELVAVDESGRDQLASLEQPEVQKLRSIFSHQNLDLADTITKVRTMLLCAEVYLHIAERSVSLTPTSRTKGVNDHVHHPHTANQVWITGISRQRSTRG